MGEYDAYVAIAKALTCHSEQCVHYLRGNLHPKSLGVRVVEVDEFGQEKYDGGTPENWWRW